MTEHWDKKENYKIFFILTGEVLQCNYQESVKEGVKIEYSKLCNGQLDILIQQWKTWNREPTQLIQSSLENMCVHCFGFRVLYMTFSSFCHTP